MLEFLVRKGGFMGIQKCEACGYQFRWKEIQKAIRWYYKPLVCRKCDTEHRITIRTRMLVVFLGSLIMVLLIKTTFQLEIALLSSILVILFFPYFVQYKADVKTKNKIL